MCFRRDCKILINIENLTVNLEYFSFENGVFVLIQQMAGKDHPGDLHLSDSHMVKVCVSLNFLFI